MTCRKQTWTSFVNELLADESFLTKRCVVLQADLAVIERVLADSKAAPGKPAEEVFDRFEASIGRRGRQTMIERNPVRLATLVGAAWWFVRVVLSRPQRRKRNTSM